MTLQSTLRQSIPNGPLTTTSINNILGFDYAFDQDETRGLLAGVQSTLTDTGSPSQRSDRIRSAMSAAIINGLTTGSSRAASAFSPLKARSS